MSFRNGTVALQVFRTPRAKRRVKRCAPPGPRDATPGYVDAMAADIDLFSFSWAPRWRFSKIMKTSELSAVEPPFAAAASLRTPKLD
jgi:hypothetical protein